jgi:MFS transporter
VTSDRAPGMGPATDRPKESSLGCEVWIVAGVVIVGMFMSVLDTTIVNVALETLSRDLDSPLSTIQWVSSGYLLSLAVVIPLTGWATERFGSKRLWMIAIAVFAASSALCGLAWSDGWLIFFRVLQGFGGGMIMPVGMSLLAQTAGPKHVGRVMSVVGVPMLLGPILARSSEGRLSAAPRGDGSSTSTCQSRRSPLCSRRACSTPIPAELKPDASTGVASSSSRRASSGSSSGYRRPRLREGSAIRLPSLR